MNEPFDPNEFPRSMKHIEKAISKACEANKQFADGLREFKKAAASLQAEFPLTAKAGAFVLNPLSWIASKFASVYRRLFKPKQPK